MKLDDYSDFSKIDKQGMLGQIDELPDQLQSAWDLGQRQPLPDWSDIQQVVIAGMGGSAIGADLLASYAEANCRVPVIVHRDYDLPAWARGPKTLVIASSHSGNTEETLSGFEAAGEQGCRKLVIATGGKLAQAARDSGTPVWTFEHNGQPRSAVGFSFGLLLAVFWRLKLLPDPAAELKGAIKAMREQQKSLFANIPPVNNPAKRIAGQMVGRWVTMIGSGVLAPVARRWKGQCSEVAKAWAQFEYLPEADHNTLAGVNNPESLLSQTMVIFLRSGSDHPRNYLRAELTRKSLMLEGFGTDFVEARGDTPLAHLWTALHFGDYTTYYLAMAYEVDPTPIPSIENFKDEMKTAG